MNLKFTQFKYTNTVKDNDLIPVVRTNDNYILSAISIYNYLSGDIIKNVSTSYRTYSSLFLSSNLSANSVFTTYNQNSSFYVTTNTIQSISAFKEFFENVNFKKSLSSVLIYTPSGTSDLWNSASTFVKSNSSNIKDTINIVSNLSSNWQDTYNGFSSLSGISVISDTTQAPAATAIKNIIAITQTTYDNLVIKDPYTFYVIY